MAKIRRTWIFSLAYNSPRMVRESIEHTLKNNELNFDHKLILMDVKYPIGGVVQNSIEMQQISRDYNFTYLRPYKNRGVSGNWNWFLKEVEAHPEDIVYCICPDGRVQKPNWISAIKDVFETEDDAYCICPNQHKFTGGDITVEQRQTPNGVNYLSLSRLVAWSLAAFKVEPLKIIGGLKEKRPFYGFIEDATHDVASKFGYNFYKLKDYYDNHIYDVDEHYRMWKDLQVQGLITLDLETWLKKENLI